MNQSFSEVLKTHPIWQQQFKDWDELLENGILACENIPLQARLMHSIIRTAQLYEENWTRKLERFDISIAQAMVLKMLYMSRNGEMSQEELSRKIYKSKANISTILSRIEDKGWIKRKVYEQNKREKHITLTPTGKKKVEEILESYCKNKKTEPVFSEKKYEELLKELKKLRQRLKEEKDNGCC